MTERTPRTAAGLGRYDPAHHDPSVSRRPQNRRDDDWIRALLGRVRVGRVATLWPGEDGSALPFITPLAFAYRPQEHDLVYHTNVVGRLRANTERGGAADCGDGEAGAAATFEASEIGAFLPSNSPLELTVQYRSVIAFGRAHLIGDPAEARAALALLSERVFPDLRVGRETRPITGADLARTSVYRLKIGRWSGKENWKDAAVQEPDWPPLTPELARPRRAE